MTLFKIRAVAVSFLLGAAMFVGGPTALVGGGMSVALAQTPPPIPADIAAQIALVRANPGDANALANLSGLIQSEVAANPALATSIAAAANAAGASSALIAIIGSSLATAGDQLAATGNPLGASIVRGAIVAANNPGLDAAFNTQLAAIKSILTQQGFSQTILAQVLTPPVVYGSGKTQ